MHYKLSRLLLSTLAQIQDNSVMHGTLCVCAFMYRQKNTTHRRVLFERLLNSLENFAIQYVIDL